MKSFFITPLACAAIALSLSCVIDDDPDPNVDADGANDEADPTTVDGDGDSDGTAGNADDGADDDADSTSSPDSDSADGGAVPALDACIAIMDVWWDQRICPPIKVEQQAAWCLTKEGGTAFTAGERLDLCILLTDTYAIPQTVEQSTLDQCLADMQTNECWEWVLDALDCEDPPCSDACDSIRVLEFCHEAGGRVCHPAQFQGC